MSAYSAEHDTACERAAVRIQEAACDCHAECCIGHPGQLVEGGCRGAGCAGNPRAELCGDPTNDPAPLAACEAALPDAACMATGEPSNPMSYVLPDACEVPELR